MVHYDCNKLKDPRDKRLAREHELIDELCRRSSKISYEIIKQAKGFPPEGYKIIFDNLRSIVGVNRDNSPIYGTHHEAEIIFPPAYPGAEGAPKCKMLTDIWHPNIRSKDPAKGRICINSKALGAWHTLDMLAMRIGQMLQYKNYHALDQDPWPEDAEVARWVRDYAERRGIVDKSKRIFVDNSELLDPESNFDEDFIFCERTDGRSRLKLKVEEEPDSGMSFKPRQAKCNDDDNLDFDFKSRK